jgi:uncharacterized cupin superfamily protein
MSQSHLNMSQPVINVPEMRVRGVIDLRAYAANAEPTRDWLTGGGTPAFVDDNASVVSLAPVGEGRVQGLPCDEFVILLSGTLTIESVRGVTVINTGCSAVLPAGLNFGWRAAAGTIAIIVACPAVAGATEDIVLIDKAASIQPSNPPAADLLVGPTPSCRNHSDYRSTNGEFVCGAWDSTPYHRRAMLYRHIELMHLLDGSVTFEDATGSVTFGKGDIFLAMRGAECAWISHVHVKKVYAIHRPA